MITVTLNGNTYEIPEQGEETWGDELTAFLTAIPQGVLQKTAGNFTITADLNLGATYGVIGKYFTTRTTLPSTAGVLRLAISDSIGWRNTANGANLLLSVNGSDQLTFNGTVLQTSGNYITALTGDVTATGPGSVAATVTNVANSATTGTAVNTPSTLVLRDGSGDFAAGTITAALTGIASGNLVSPMTATGDVIYASGVSTAARLAIGSTGQVLTVASGIPSWATPAPTGVTSVALTVPSFLNVSGSPITSTGTLAVTLASQSANLVLASPSGSSGTPSFRALTLLDMPSGLFNSISPMTTAGDLIIGGVSGAGTRLGIGTAGQILKVVSGAPAWSAGGGGASPLTTKGDLYTYSTTDDRLAVGANDTVLVADSTQATGLRWAVSGSTTGSVFIDRFSGDGSTVDFTLAVDPVTENNTDVYISGLYQQKDTYSISSTTLSFSTAPPTGTNNVEVSTGKISASPLTTTGDIAYASAANTANRLAIGSAGQFLSVVSGIPGWVGPNINLGYATYTAPTTITLTVASPRVIRVVNAGSTQDVTLPDATTLQNGIEYIVFMAGSGTLNVRSTTGILLKSIVTTAVKYHFLQRDISTPDGSWVVDPVWPIIEGGTGQSTAAAAFSALSPVTTTGDIIYSSSGTTNSRLAVGAAGKVMASTGTLPAWTGFTTASKTANYTGLVTEDLILCNTNAFTITLPSAALAVKPLRIQKIGSDTNAITIARAGSDTINGATSTTLNTQYEIVTLASDGGTAWYVLSREYPRALVAYTPTGTWTTNATYSGWWSRIGNVMMLRIFIALAGAPTGGTLSALNIPSGYTIDTGFLGAASTATILGMGKTTSAGNPYLIHGVYNSTTAIGVRYEITPSGANPVPLLANGSVSATTPATYAASDFLDIVVYLPIVGWN